MGVHALESSHPCVHQLMPKVPAKLPPYRKLQRIVDTINELIDFAISLRPMGSLNTFTSHTGLGVRRQGAAEEIEGPQRVQFRGEFAKGFAYSNGDLVRVSAGPEAATYIAIKDVPANPNNDPTYLPWTGFGYWVLLARLTDQSQWV